MSATTLTRPETETTPKPGSLRKPRNRSEKSGSKSSKLKKPRNQRKDLVLGIDVTPVVDTPLSKEQIDAFGHQIVELKLEQKWTNKDHAKLVCDYVHQLAKGERWVPTALAGSSRRLVSELFAKFCEEKEIRYTLLYPSSE